MAANVLFHVVNFDTVVMVLLSTTCVTEAAKSMDCTSAENYFVDDPHHGRIMCRTVCPPVKTGVGNMEYCRKNCPRKLLPSQDCRFSIRLCSSSTTSSSMCIRMTVK